MTMAKHESRDSVASHDLFSKRHFMDKVLRCNGCKEDIFIPFNQVGGFWHLGGWTNPHGVKFWGGYCSKCFYALDGILPNVKDQVSDN